MKVKGLEIVEPGQSYNPDYEQHQDVLGAALAEEIDYRNKLEQMDQLKKEYDLKKINKGGVSGYYSYERVSQ